MDLNLYLRGNRLQNVIKLYIAINFICILILNFIIKSDDNKVLICRKLLYRFKGL